MELLVISMSLLNVITSFLVYRKLTTHTVENVQYVFVQPSPPESGSPEPVLEEIPPVEKLVNPLPDDRYHAWRNVKEEPVKAAPVSYHQQRVPVSGPLERPAGFV